MVNSIRKKKKEERQKGRKKEGSQQSWTTIRKAGREKVVKLEDSLDNRAIDIKVWVGIVLLPRSSSKRGGERQGHICMFSID